MNIKIVPFKADHLLSIIDEDHPLVNPGEFKQVAEIKEKEGYSATMVSEMGQILACGGVLPQGSRMGIAWSFITRDCKKIPLTLLKSVRKFLSEAHERFNFARLELNTLTKEDCRFAEALGFRYEGELFNFGKNGETFYRFSLCR